MCDVFCFFCFFFFFLFFFFFFFFFFFCGGGINGIGSCEMGWGFEGIRDRRD